MAKKNPAKTPRSKVTAALRRLFLRSRERNFTLKTSGYRCECCGVKQSKAKGREVKVEVHHKSGIKNWAEIIDAIFSTVLNLTDLQILCETCHKKKHAEEKTK
jgi:predicted HNH restriction endonuclease